MKQLEFLFDENISLIVKEHFSRKGFNCETVKEKMFGATDSSIAEYALENNKIIITLDKDFGLIFSNMGTSVILLRLKNSQPERIISHLESFFTDKTDFGEDDLPKLFVIKEKKIRER